VKCFLIFDVISSVYEAPRQRNNENKDVCLMLCEYYWWVVLPTCIVLAVYGTNQSINTVSNHSLCHCLSNQISGMAWTCKQWDISATTLTILTLLALSMYFKLCNTIVLFCENSQITSSTFMGHMSKWSLGNGRFDGAPLEGRVQNYHHDNPIPFYTWIALRCTITVGIINKTNEYSHASSLYK